MFLFFSFLIYTTAESHVSMEITGTSHLYSIPLFEKNRYHIYPIMHFLIMREEVTVHGALHLAARHPAGKIAVACIQPLAVRRLFNGLDALQFATGWAVNCNGKRPPASTFCFFALHKTYPAVTIMNNGTRRICVTVHTASCTCYTASGQ